MKFWALRIAALAAALTLGACGGGERQLPGDGLPPPAGEPSSALVSRMYFHYESRAHGASDVEIGTLSCPAAGCAASDLRELSGRPGTETRDGFGTAFDQVELAPTVTVSGGSAFVSAAWFERYGFWGEHGYAAVEIGRKFWVEPAVWPPPSSERRDFMTAHAWAAGEASGTNPAGTGSATWRGVAEVAILNSEPSFRFWIHPLQATAEVRIADLSRPLVDVVIDLSDYLGALPLRWTGMEPDGGRFAKGRAGTDRIDGRFHGPGHEEAWAVFETGAFVGAFGAKRQ